MKTDKPTGAFPESPENDAIRPPASGEDGRLRQLEAENGELRAAIREARTREAVTALLNQSGARTPSLLFASVSGDVQFADDGSVANAEALVKRLQRQFPEQFVSPGSASIDGGAGRATPTVLTKDVLRTMSAAEIAKLDWTAVKRALRDK